LDSGMFSVSESALNALEFNELKPDGAAQ